jgi:nitrogen fixation protein FixH
MEMVRSFVICAGVAAWMVPYSAAADFSLTIGNAFAALVPGNGSTPVVKKSAASFAVRLQDCPTVDQAKITGLMEGLVAGARASAPVNIQSAAPGIYLVSPASNEQQGVWVVSLSATCGSAKAGALVPIGPHGFLREQAKLLQRTPTKAEIDAALKELSAP